MRKFITVISLLLCMVLVLCACQAKDDNPVDENPTTTKALEATKAPDATATVEPTASPTPGPTLRPISAEEKGKPQKDAEVLIFEDFEDGQLDVDKFKTRQEEYMQIRDGQMHIEEVWTAVSPEYDYSLGTKHNQYEFSVDFNITHKQPDAPHVAFWVGARVPEVEFSPDYPGGFWLAFNYSKGISVYPGGNNFTDSNGNIIEGWAAKCFGIDAPEDFTTTHKVTLIDTGDALYYYMNTATEEYYLLLKVEFDGADLICYGHDGTQVFAGENVVNEAQEFSVFSHRTKSHSDNLTVKGY